MRCPERKLTQEQAVGGGTVGRVDLHARDGSNESKSNAQEDPRESCAAADLRSLASGSHHGHHCRDTTLRGSRAPTLSAPPSGHTGDKPRRATGTHTRGRRKVNGWVNVRPESASMQEEPEMVTVVSTLIASPTPRPVGRMITVAGAGRSRRRLPQESVFQIVVFAAVRAPCNRGRHMATLTYFRSHRPNGDPSCHSAAL